MWKTVGRDVYLDPPQVGASVRVCDDVAFNWVENLSQNSAEGCIHVSVGNANYAPYGAFSGSRTSDGGGIGHMSLSYQDLKTSGGGSWGHYVESFMAADAHKDNTSFGVEYALVNKRTTVGDVNPYQTANYGMFSGIHVGVGKEVGGNAQNISSLMTFLNVEGGVNSVARKGLVFANNVLKFFGGIANAINFAMGHAIRWYDQYGRPGPVIYSEAGGNSDYASGIKFTNGAIHFTDVNGIHQFSFNTITGALYLGNGSVGPNGTIRVFVAGVPYLITARKE